ncbi:MAG: hypothetical protein ABI629_05940 [bacterium]
MTDRNGAAMGWRVRMARRLITLAALLSFGVGTEAAAEVPLCVGDCDGNRQVSVDELVRGVNIALGALPVSSCPIFDRNDNQAVSIDELIAGVNAALQGCFPLNFRGLCLRPGAGGLVSCAAGSPVRLSLCLDRSRCLFDSSARRLLRTANLDAGGRFSFFLDDVTALNALLLVESDLEQGAVYRGFAFGPAVAGGVIDNLSVDPRSEAVARIINQNGLGLFSDLGLRELLDIIYAALANLNFAGLGADAAATLATTTAAQDATVQAAIDLRRSTPTPLPSPTLTFTPSQTATTALTATVTRTLTITLTPSVTQTPTPTRTASATPTSSATPSTTSTASSTPTLTRTATVTATSTITMTPTPTSSPTATLPPLNLAVEVNPDPLRPGETAEVSFIITNSGGSNLNSIELKSVLPMAIQPFLDTLASGTGRCGVNQLNTCNPGDTMTWRFIGSLAPGEGLTLRVPPIIAAGTPNGTQIAFSGTATADALTATATYTAEVQSSISYPFDLALDQDREPVPAGSLLTYTVAFGFRAVVGSADSVLRLQPPPGTSFVAASDGGAPIAGGDVEWGLGTLTPGDGGIRRLTVQVDAQAPNGRLLPAQASIQADSKGAKRANLINRVQAAQPLGLTMETNPDPARPGDNVEVAVTITNPSTTGTMATLDVVVPDLVDTFTDGTTMGGGICGPFTPGSVCERRARVRFSVNVPPRDGVTVRLDPIVNAAAQNGAVIHFQAYLVNVQGSNIAAARSAVHVETAPIWDLAVDEDRDPVGAADLLTYVLTARHRPSDAAPVDALLALQLPAGVTLVSASDDGTLADGHVSWDLGTLALGEIARREVAVRVDNAIAPATMLAAEAVLRSASDSLAAQRVRTLTRTAFGSPLALSIVAHPDPVRQGESLETELTVSNTGDTAIGGYRFEARLPDGVDAFFASLSTGANCSNVTLQCASRELVRWVGPGVPVGGSATVRMPPIVSNSTPDGTLLRLQVRVSDLSGGPTGNRNSVLSRTVVVDGDTPFDLALTATPDPVTPGQMLVYTLHYGRPAVTAATSAVLHLQLPAGVFFVSASDGGVAVGDDAAEWNLGALAAGGSVQLTAVVDAVLPGSVLQARATIEDAGEAHSVKRAEVVTTAGTSPLVFTLSAAPDPVLPGSVVTVSMSVTNNGVSAVNNLSLEGIVPPESNGFLDNTTSGGGGGRCGAFTFNTCATNARVLWSIPTIGAGQTVTVTMPPPIRPALAPGRVVRFIGRLQENISAPPILAIDAVTVGE